MRRILLAILLLGLPIVALAQQESPPPVGNFWYDNAATPPLWRPASTAYPVPIAGSFSASPFQWNGGSGSLTATASSSSSTLIPSGTPTTAVLRMANTGTTAVSCVFATGAATATASNIIIQPASAVVRAVGSYDHVACIDQTGSASNVVVLESGTGLGNDSGGGGGGSGSSGAVYGPTANASPSANPPVQIGGTVDGGATSNVATWKVNSSGIGFISGVLPSGSVASGAIASGAVASGAIASGAVASGAYASGSIGSGAMVDLLTFQGTKAAGTAAANSLLTGGVYNSSPLTLTNGQQASIQFDANGYAKVNVAAGGAGGGAVYGPTAAGSAAANPPVLCGGTIDGTATGTVKNCEIVAGGSAGLTDLGLVVQDPQLLAAAGKGVATNGATYPSQSIGIGWKDGSGNIQPFAAATPPPFNIGQINGVTPLMGNGVTGTGSPRVTIASDNTSNSNPWLVSRDSTVNSATHGLYANLLQGDAVLSASNPIFSQPAAGTSGGSTPYHLIAAATDNSTGGSALAGAHTIYSIQTGNISASTPYYLKFYDKATAPTCASDTVVQTVLIPPNNSGNNVSMPVGKSFTSGIGFCVVAGIADNNDTSAAAATVIIDFGYK